MVQLIPLYVWSRSITGSISLGALFFFQMVRDAQDPKRRWPSIVTERNSVLSHVVQPICFKFDHCFLAAKKGSKALVPGTSCKDILDSGDAQGDGEYWIDPTASGDPFRVYCDMVTDGGKFKSLPSFQTGWLAFKEWETRLTYNGAAWHKECEMSHFLASSPKAYIRQSIEHPCYGQLTAVRKEYPLTKVAWLYRVFRCKVSGFFIENFSQSHIGL